MGDDHLGISNGGTHACKGISVELNKDRGACRRQEITAGGHAHRVASRVERGADDGRGGGCAGDDGDIGEARGSYRLGVVHGADTIGIGSRGACSNRSCRSCCPYGSCDACGACCSCHTCYTRLSRGSRGAEEARHARGACPTDPIVSIDGRDGKGAESQLIGPHTLPIAADGHHVPPCDQTGPRICRSVSEGLKVIFRGGHGLLLCGDTKPTPLYRGVDVYSLDLYGGGVE